MSWKQLKLFYVKLQVAVLFLLPFSASAQFTWTPECYQAYDAMFRLNFKLTDQLLSKERSAHPGNMVPVYLSGYADFLRTFISEEEKDFSKMKERNEMRIDTIQNSKEDPYKRLCLTELYLEQAIIRLKFKEYFGAAYEVRKAYHNLEDNQEKYPSFLPNLRAAGFMHAVIGSVPGNYQWVTNMLGLKGTINQGLGELNQILNASYKQPSLNYLTDETIVLLTFLEMNLKRNKNDETIRQRLNTIRQPERKPLILFAKSVFHFANGENDSVIRILSTRKPDTDSYRLNYLDYMEANARLYALDNSAEQYYRKYISNYKGRSYVMSSWQRIGWVRLLNNDINGYKEAISHCTKKNAEKVVADEDKQAIADADRGTIPNIPLLRCRLLFDGGYYNRALAELAGKPTSMFPEQHDKIEFTYRLARIFDKTGKKDQAEKFYKETLKNGKDKTWYFAANSGLLLAQLYEELGNKKLAAEYYKLTLEMRNHEYQNSIDQKAKAGLDRLSE